MGGLSGKRIIVGLTGGIAAYKTAELVRRIREAGADVRVVMTASAQEFITPLTFQALSGNVVSRDLLDPDEESAMGHIALARWADLVVIAPATANCLATLAHGFASDLLSALVLAASIPIVLAPAMNQRMWAAAATQHNADLLRARGFHLLGPDIGDQACGEVGPGRMREPAALLSDLCGFFVSRTLDGVKVMVTAGPTREAIDPVRFISNRSSGKMGYAVAEAACNAGAEVILLSGQVALPPVPGVEMVYIESADELACAVHERRARCGIFIAAAAVADYRIGRIAEQKMKKSRTALQLDLVPTRDILAEVSAASPRPFTVGFAAETEDLERHAREKLERKNLDMVAGNLVGGGRLGFDSDDNELLVLWPDGKVWLPRMHKRTLAEKLVTLISERFHAQHTS